MNRLMLFVDTISPDRVNKHAVSYDYLIQAVL